MKQRDLAKAPDAQSETYLSPRKTSKAITIAASARVKSPNPEHAAVDQNTSRCSFSPDIGSFRLGKNRDVDDSASDLSLSDDDFAMGKLGKGFQGGARRVSACAVLMSARRGSDGAATMAPVASMKQRSTLRAEIVGVKSPDTAAWGDEPGFQSTAAEWTARIQSTEAVRTRQKECAKQLLCQLEAVIPKANALAAHDHSKLTDRITSELGETFQHLCRHAYDGVKHDMENLQRLRKECSVNEQKMASMNVTYLKEISILRDRTRKTCEMASKGIAEVEEASNVVIYEPLGFLTDEVRRLCLQVLDEKLKAIFAYDPNLKSRVDASELARFEDACIREKLASFERLNTRLRNELREAQDRLRKVEVSAEKSTLELDQAHADARKQEMELDELRKELEEAKMSLSRQRLGQAAAVEKAAENAAEHAAAAATQRAEQKKVILKTAAVQTEPVSVTDGRRKSRSSVTLEADSFSSKQPVLAGGAALKALAGNQADLIIEIKSMQRAAEIAKADIQVRDSRNDSLQEELLDLKGKLVALEEEAAERKRAFGQAEDVEELRIALEKANQDRTLAMEAQQSLRSELAKATVLAARADEERLKLLKVRSVHMATDPQVAAELEKQVEQSKALGMQVEQLKAKLSLLLSRNLSLELQVAAGPRPPELKEKSRGALGAELVKQDKELTMLSEKQGVMREKVTVQRAQIQEVLKENQVLHLAMQEMQTELKSLTQQLKPQMQEGQDMDFEMKVVLERMEKVVRDGGGGYLRLHKEAQLREIANDARKGVRVDEACSPKEPSSPKRALSMKQLNMANVQGGKPLVIPKRSPTITLPMNARAELPEISNQVVHLTSSGSGRSPSSRPPNSNSLPPVRERAFSSDCETRGNLVLGGKGGMAVFGGVGSMPLRSART